MGTNPPRLGDTLADDVVVYRAFAVKGYRERHPKRVRAMAYYRPPDHADGISLGDSPSSAVAHLSRNFGFCSVTVGRIHGLPYGLKVCPDLDDPGHILLCGVPCLIANDDERGRASEIANALAKISTVESLEHYPPQETPPPLS